MLLFLSSARRRVDARRRAHLPAHPAYRTRDFAVKSGRFGGFGGARVAKVSKVKNNFNRIARDLDRAVRLAFVHRSVDGFLFAEARELSWSFAGAEPRPFRFAISAMARVSGLDRMGLTRRCRAMVNQRFFVDQGGGLLLIEKDYRRWLNTDLDGPLLTTDQVAWCLAIKRDAGGEDSSPQSEDSSPQGDSRSVEDSSPQGVRTPVLRGEDSSPQARHKEDRAPELLTREYKSGGGSAGAGAREEPATEPRSEPDGPAVANDPADVRRLADFAETLFPLLEFGPKVTAYARVYPLAWIKAALDATAGAGKRRWDYPLGILRRYERDGFDAAPAPTSTAPAAPRRSKAAERYEAQQEAWRQLAEAEEARDDEA